MTDWAPLLNNLLNVVQVIALAYIAAKFRSGPNGGSGPNR